MINKPATIDEYVGNKIRDRRKALRLSQAKLADLIGVSYQQVQRYESGANTLTLNRLMQLAFIMNVKPDYFYEGAPVDGDFGKHIPRDAIVRKRVTPLRILLVEDSAGDEILFRKALEISQSMAEIHCIREAETVMDFLQNHQVKYGQPRPELIILDLNMPKVDGLTLLKQIKKNQTLHDIPVLFLTNSMRLEDVREAYRNNANGFIQKSSNFDDFCVDIVTTVKYWAKTVALPMEHIPSAA
jgi:CheY-like chemotaxis protein/DNA-binding XRE family transcriptional regulator